MAVHATAKCTLCVGCPSLRSGRSPGLCPLAPSSKTTGLGAPGATALRTFASWSGAASLGVLRRPSATRASGSGSSAASAARSTARTTSRPAASKDAAQRFARRATRAPGVTSVPSVSRLRPRRPISGTPRNSVPMRHPQTPTRVPDSSKAGIGGTRVSQRWQV